MLGHVDYCRCSPRSRHCWPRPEPSSGTSHCPGHVPRPRAGVKWTGRGPSCLSPRNTLVGEESLGRSPWEHLRDRTSAEGSTEGPLVNQKGERTAPDHPLKDARTWEPRVAAVSQHRPSDPASPRAAQTSPTTPSPESMNLASRNSFTET